MPVDTSIRIDPYQSTVPLAPLMQMPEQDLQSQPAPRIYSKATGVAEVADATMKGLLKGLQMKEEKKYKTAQAVMQAQDAGISAAKKNYEDLLMTEGAFVNGDPKNPNTKTQAAYAAWQTAVETAAKQRQAYAIPEKGKKQAGTKTKKTADEGAPVAGFGASLKQYFERNPQIIPELAIIGMKAQVTPYGQMAPEQQAAKIQMDAMQRDAVIQKATFDATEARKKYAGKSEADLEKMPATPNADGTPNKTFKNALEEYRNSIEFLTPIRPSTKSRVVVSETNPDDYQTIPEDAQIPRGYKPYEKPTSLTTTKPGTELDFTKNALAGYGVDDKTPPAKKAELEKYLHDWWNWKQSQSSKSVATSTTDAAGNRTNTNQTTRGAAAPKPPAGFAPVGDDGQPLKEVKSGSQGVPSYAPQGSTQYTVGAKPKGMVEEGNIPVWNRPTVQNADGSHSSELSISMGDDKGREVLVPTVADGKFLTPDGKMPPLVNGKVPPAEEWDKYPAWKALKQEAWKRFQQTGENLGKFDSPDDADAYAGKLHNRGSARGKMTAAPSASQAAGGKGKMTPPPGADGKPTLTQATRTQKVETQEKGMYDKATAAYQKQLNTNRAKAPDKASLDAANAQAEKDYTAAKAKIVLWKADQVRAVGGNPWKATANGGKYGTMDGVNWVDVTTGMPYQEQ